MELMVVVIIVAVLAALAIPSLSTAKYDRHVYDNAGYIAELIRTARTRAVGRGAATLVSLSTNGDGTDRGRFYLYEAVGQNLLTASDVTNRTPINSCTAATTVWAAAPALGTPPTSTIPTGSALYLAGIDLNGNVNGQANIITTVTVNVAGSTLAPASPAYLCFTPTGRVYASTTTTFTAGAAAFQTALITVRRSGVGLTRTVLVPPNGAARITSN